MENKPMLNPPHVGQTSANGLPNPLQAQIDLIPALEKLEIQNLQQEYEWKILKAKESARIKGNDFNAILGIMTAYVIVHTNAPDKRAVIAAEIEIGAINLDNCTHSLQIGEIKAALGQVKAIESLCAITGYFLQQLNLKDNMSEVQLMQYCTRLLHLMPYLKLREYLLALSTGIKSGGLYSRIDASTIDTWIAKFYELQSIHNDKTNTTPEGSRGIEPWRDLEKRMELYDQRVNQEEKIRAEAREKQRRQTDNNNKFIEGL